MKWKKFPGEKPEKNSKKMVQKYLICDYEALGFQIYLLRQPIIDYFITIIDYFDGVAPPNWLVHFRAFLAPDF